jgi:DNA-binding IclR family transcriptional regulator
MTGFAAGGVVRGAEDWLLSHVESLPEKTGLGVGLAVLDDLEVVYLLRLSGRGDDRSWLSGRGDDRSWLSGRGDDRSWLPARVASRAPAYCTAAGKVLLAGLPEDERRERVGRIPFDKDGVPTAWTAELLWSDLEETRREGVGIDDEESALGIQAIAVGVRGVSGGVVAALNLVGWQGQISIREMLDDHLEALRKAAEEISHELAP